MLPVLGWKVIECKQDVSVLSKHSLASGYLALIGFEEAIEGLIRIGFSLRSIDLPQPGLGVGLKLLRQLIEDVRRLVYPAPLRLGGGPDLRQRFPKPTLRRQSPAGDHVATPDQPV